MHRSVHRPSVLSLAAVLTFALSSHAARAEDYAAVPLEPGATLSLWSSQVHAPGRYALALGLQARSIELPGAPDDDDGAGREGSASNLELMGTVGVARRVDVSMAIALERTQLGDPEGTAADEQSSALGDVRLVPRVRLLGADSASGLAVLIPVSKPGGPLQSGDDVFEVEPRLAATFASGRVTALVNAGYRLRTGGEAGSSVRGGAGAEVFVADSWAMLGEVLGVWSARGGAGAGSEPSGEARVGARYASSGWAAQFGAGRGVLGAAGEPDWRLLASVSFSPDAEEPAVTAAPIAVAAVVTSDDYLRAEADWRPPEETASEPLAGVAPARTVTPQPGVSGASAPAEAPEADPPETDVLHSSAMEPAAAPDEHVDVSTPALQIAEIEIRSEDDRDGDLPHRIAQVIQFAPNQMRLDEAQLAAVDEVAEYMHKAPRDARLIVEGHSDSAGPPGFNWRLSRMRASTVRYHLIQRGIAWQRISVRAYGASRPAAPEAALPGKSSNRRVEFRVTH